MYFFSVYIFCHLVEVLAAFAFDFVFLCSKEWNDVSQAIAASMATFFKEIGLADATGKLDNSVLFNTRDKRALWLKSSRKVWNISVLRCAIIVTFITSLWGVVAKYCDEYVRACMCVSVCLSGYLQNHTHDLYQMFCACCL